MAVVLQGVPQLQSLECSCLGQCSDAGSGSAHRVTAATAAQAARVAFSHPKNVILMEKGSLPYHFLQLHPIPRAS